MCLGVAQVLSYCHGEVYGLISDDNGLAQVNFDERTRPKELPYPKWCLYRSKSRISGEL